MFFLSLLHRRQTELPPSSFSALDKRESIASSMHRRRMSLSGARKSGGQKRSDVRCTVRRTEDETTIGRRHGSSHRRLAAPPSFLPSSHACSFLGHARATKQQQPGYINTLLALFSRPQSFLSHRSISLTTLIIQLHHPPPASTHTPRHPDSQDALLGHPRSRSARLLRRSYPSHRADQHDRLEDRRIRGDPMGRESSSSTPIGTRADPGSPSRPTLPKSPSSFTHPLAPTHPSRSSATTPPRSGPTSTPPPAA